jgi:mannose-1-phosphate guanylyltransferase
MPSNLPHRWVIVLAGGRGSRLSTLTRDRAGTVVPKQFCSLHGGRSLLADALARAALLAPPERTLMVVVQQHERFWLRELAAQAAVHVVVQPRECGTAPGVLLPLLAVLQRDPEALVTLLPSDHFVGDEASLAGDLRAAQDAAASAPHRVLLLGIRPDAPEPEYGYVLPGPGHGATRKVAAFVEKPAREHAAALIARGAVWNAFLVVARAGTLLEM